jgi:hypothetical protein
MSELKAGDQKVFEVGDKTLTIEPVPYGNVKKIFRIIGSAMTDITAGKNAVTDIPDTIDKYMPEFFPLLFRKGTHDFVTTEWIEDNLTIMTMKEILETAIKVNGLEDFFTRKGAAVVNPPGTSTFTTSSPLPTAGDLPK